MNSNNFLSRFNQGCISNDRELAEGFQRLLNSGRIWDMPSDCIQEALRLIDNGLCYAPGQLYGS